MLGAFGVLREKKAVAQIAFKGTVKKYCFLSSRIYFSGKSLRCSKSALIKFEI